MGVGQFCTNPGLLVLEKTPLAEKFIAELGAKLAAMPEAPMLNQTIFNAYNAGVAERAARSGVKLLAHGSAVATNACGVTPAIFSVGTRASDANPVGLLRLIDGAYARDAITRK